MPIKEFECQACKHRFEEILGISEPVPEKCPKCGKGPLKRLLGTFRIAGASRKSATDEFEGGEAGIPDEDFGAGDEMGGDPGFGSDDGGDAMDGSGPSDDSGGEMDAGTGGEDAGGDKTGDAG